MEIDLNKQKTAQEKARKLLIKEEEQRAERRFSKLVLDLENGKSDVLLNDELLENVPDMIATSVKNGNQDHVRLLFEQLAVCARSKNATLRERAVMVLSLCMAGLDREKHQVLTDQVTQILLYWISVENVFFSVHGRVCKQLQKYGILMLEEGLWKECNSLLEIFSKIQASEDDFSNAIKSVVGRTQDGMATEYILEELTLVCLRGRGQRRHNAAKTLVLLGRKAVVFLLAALFSSEEKDDQKRLVGLISATGHVAVPVLKDKLQEILPSSKAHNLIHIIEAMNDPTLASLLTPYFTHADMRVQQQALDCITKVMTDDSDAYLLKALFLVDDRLKAPLVNTLGPLSGVDILESFLDILAQRDTFSDVARDELLRSLVVYIRLSDSNRAVNLVKLIMEERSSQFESQTDAVFLAASQTLKILEPLATEDVSSEEIKAVENLVQGDVTFDNDPVERQTALRDVAVINNEVTVLLGKGQAHEAGLLLYEKSIEAARERRFIAAEMLKDRILEVDPNALAEVIQADEIIQEESSTSVSSDHIKIWKDLFDSLTRDEFYGLYDSFKTVEYSSGSVIVELNAENPCLYFIHSGKAKLTCKRDDEEIFLKKTGPGEIIGTEPFFQDSRWTVSFTTIEKVHVNILERKKYLELLVDYPHIEKKLSDFCSKSENVHELLEMSGEDRREYPRFPLSLIVQHTLLDEFGNPSTRGFNGEIADISCGGLSFYIKISSKKNSRLLLGRAIRTNIIIEGKTFAESKGGIVAVRSGKQEKSDFSVHVQFDEPLEESIIKGIVAKQ